VARLNKKAEVATAIFVALAIAVAVGGVYLLGEGITGLATAQVTVTSIIECTEDGSLGNCVLSNINADDTTYEQFRVGKGVLNRLNTSHITTLPDNIQIAGVEVCLAAYRDSTLGDDPGDTCAIIGGENATGTPTYTTALPASQGLCLNWSDTYGAVTYVCGNITSWILSKPDPKASAENLIVSFDGVEASDNNVDLWIDWVYTNISYENKTDYLKIENLSLNPALNLVYFLDYNYTVDVGNSSQLEYVNLTYKAINADGTDCHQFYVNGSCAEDLPTTVNMTQTQLLGNSWYYSPIKPDEIYPQIEFADDSVYWYNSRQFMDIYAGNYHIFRFVNNYTINANTSFWIEFDAIAKPTTTKPLDVYVFDNSTTLATFQTNWLNDAHGELIGDINPGDPKHHNHTDNSSHYLETLTTNADGTIGTKHLNINNEFWIVLYSSSNKQSASWNLSYRDGSLCNTSNWWRGTGGWGTVQQTTGCPDSHIHLARQNVSGKSDGVNATACAKDANNLTNCTSTFDYFGVLPNLPPLANEILTPVSGNYYQCPINITWNHFLDPNNDLVTYSISLLNADGSFNQTINPGLTNNWYYWDCSAVADSYYQIRVNGTDTGGLSSHTDMGENFTIDKTPSSINLTSPNDNAVDGNGLVYFNCLANDVFALKNISLYIYGTRNQTILTNASSYLANFTLNLPNGIYNWSCGVYDQAGNWNISQNRTLIVNTSAVPISTNFTGNTTSWAAEPDLSNVCDAVLDNPVYDQIRWFNCVNAVDQNFDANVIFDYNYVELITSALHSSFNTSAEITMRNLTWDAPPLVYRNGILCQEPDCSNVSYNTTTGTAVFNVTHFTNFTTQGNTRMEIWDETDSDKQNLTKYPNEQIKFYSNYTKKTDGSPVTGAACTIDFTDSAGNVMAYNATSTLYEYNRSFGASGIKPYNVTCSATGFQTITLSDSANVSQPDFAPYWSNNQTNIVVTYSPVIPSYFNITWQDDFGVSSAWFESNYSGSSQNYSMNLIAGNSTNGTYNYSTILPAGNYYWKSYANDTSNQWNSTDQWNFAVAKALTFVNLSLNGVENNISVTYPQTITAIYGTNVLSATMYRNGSDVSGENNMPVTLAAGYYNYTAVNPGNNNYTPSSKTFFATVNKAISTCSLIITPPDSQTYPGQVNASCTCINPEASAILYRNGTDITATENDQLITLAAGDYFYNCTVPETQNYTSAQNTTIYTVNKANHTIHLAINGTEADRSFIYPTLTNATGYLEISQGASAAELLRNGLQVDTGSPAFELTTLGAGNYNYTYRYPASQNYTAQSITRFLEINQSTTALTLIASPSWSELNGTQTNISCYANNNGVNVTLWRNTTFVGSSVGGTVSDVQTLSPGTYNYTCNNSASQNYTADSESNILIITAKMPSSCSLSFDPASGQTHPVSVNASCSCTNPETTAQLWRNGTNVTDENNQFVSLAAGNYAYVCNASETATYEYAENSSTYVINKAATVLNLTASPSWNETYGTSTTVNCAANNNEVTEQLFVNGTPTVIPYTTTHAAGAYNYTCNATASQNYTAAETPNILTINQANTFVNLSLNGAENNLTIIYPQTITAVYSTNALTAIMYRNGSDVSSENNTPVILAAGYYNYTAVNPGNANYTSSSKTFFATVNKNLSSCSLTFNDASPSTYGTAVNASCACTNPEAPAVLYRDGNDVTGTEEGKLIVLAAGNYSYACNVSETQNYTSASDAENYTIEKAGPVLSLTASPGWTVLNGTQTNVSCYANTGQVTISLYRNGTFVNSSAGGTVSDVQNLSLGTYPYVCNNTAVQNYTAASVSNTLTITTYIPPPPSPGGGGGGGAREVCEDECNQTDLECLSQTRYRECVLVDGCRKWVILETEEGYICRDGQIIKEPEKEIEIEKPVCGNGICEEGENSQNCCLDCGCPENFRCEENVCVEIPEPVEEKPKPELTLKSKIKSFVKSYINQYLERARETYELLKGMAEPVSKIYWLVFSRLIVLLLLNLVLIVLVKRILEKRKQEKKKDIKKLKKEGYIVKGLTDSYIELETGKKKKRK